MTDIVLSDVKGGYNRSSINSNFEKIEEVVNTELLHLEGGNNIMKQDIDLDSNSLLNVNLVAVQELTVRGTSFDEAVQAIADEAQVSADASEASAVASEASSVQSGISASESAASAEEAAISAELASLKGITPLIQPRQFGDGVASVFSTPASGTLGAEDTSFSVHLDGIYQRPTIDFTIDPANGDLTTVSGGSPYAPGVGVHVDITYFRPNTMTASEETEIVADGTTASRTLGDWTEKEILSYDSVADAKADTLLEVGRRIKTYGYYAAGDGGAEYVVVTGGTGTDEGGLYHDLANGLQLALIRSGGISVDQFGATGDGVTDDSTSIQNAMNALPTGGVIEFSSGKVYVLRNKVSHTTASQLNVRGNGCTLKNETHPTDAQMLEFRDVGSCLNFSMSNFLIDNNGNRSRAGQIIIRKGNNSSVEHISCNSNSYASTVIEWIDPFTCSTKNVNYEASGGGIAVKIQGEELNLSTNLVENILCNAGTPVFLGGEPAAGVAQLIESTTLINIHAVRATGTPPTWADESNVNGSGAGASSVFVDVAAAANFDVGSKIFMGDVGRLEHNYIDSITSGFLELRYPTTSAAGAGSRVMGGDVGMVVSGQSTFGTVFIGPHTEAMGVGILTSDTKAFQCDSLVTANNIIGMKLDAMEEGIIRNSQSFAGVDSVSFIEATDIVSLGTGRTTSRITIDGVTQIGVTPVPNIFTNNSGHDAVFYREGDNTGYLAPTLLNSWVNGSPTNREVAGYNKDSLGFVRLRGWLNTGVAGTVVFNLPVGYRPRNGQEFSCASNGLGKVLVDVAGNVTAQVFTSEIDLSSIVFKAIG